MAGFRLEARTLAMRALGIGGHPPEPRLRLYRVDEAAAGTEASRLLDEADLVIAALGYQPNALPVVSVSGQPIELAQDSRGSAALVDRRCRVLDVHRRPIPGLMGIGLAAGFVPSGALGGEPSFRGQTNGIWLWQNGVGAMITDALLDGKAEHVAA